MFRISYYKTEDTQLMMVTFHQLQQTIVLQPGFFYKVSGFDRKVVLGCRDVNVNILVELGFVFPSKISRKIG
jgi:hypothetical protein